MKIFFVGIHAKPKMQPLDSRTKSGKVIDKIIEAFPANECIKTNLCNIENMPEWADIPNHNAHWHSVNKPTKQDIVVLLGAFTQSNFERRGLNTINLPHPASVFYSGKNNNDYVERAISKISDKSNTAWTMCA